MVAKFYTLLFPIHYCYYAKHIIMQISKRVQQNHINLQVCNTTSSTCSIGMPSPLSQGIISDKYTPYMVVNR